jgi:surfactin synthase thioesterase subunit
MTEAAFIRRFLTSTPSLVPAGRVVYAIGDAGSGAAVWKQVIEALDSAVELRAIRLPGRESRLEEPPCRTVEAQVDDIADTLLPILRIDDRPFCVAGVCSAAATAFELARRLETGAGREPGRLVVIGQRAPLSDRETYPALGDLAPDELRAWLAEQGVFPASRNLDALFVMMEPTVRADIVAFETYTHDPEPPLRCPITVLRGAEDTWVTDDEAAAWGPSTSAETEVITIPGGHRLLTDSPRELADRLAALTIG